MDEVGETIERNLRADPHFYDEPIGGQAIFHAYDGASIYITQLGEEVNSSTEIVYYDDKCKAGEQHWTLGDAATHVGVLHGGLA